MTPRHAFAEFAEIEQRFGLDDSPLFKVLHALIEQGERHERALVAHGIELGPDPYRDTEPTIPLLPKGGGRDRR